MDFIESNIQTYTQKLISQKMNVWDPAFLKTNWNETKWNWKWKDKDSNWSKFTKISVNQSFRLDFDSVELKRIEIRIQRIELHVLVNSNWLPRIGIQSKRSKYCRCTSKKQSMNRSNSEGGAFAAFLRIWTAVGEALGGRTVPAGGRTRLLGLVCSDSFWRNHIFENPRTGHGGARDNP